MQYKIDANKLKEIVDKTVGVIGNSKNEIYEIGETARKECKNLEEELQWLKQEVGKMVAIVDSLEVHLAEGKKRLAIISKDFKNHSESELKLAYELADKIRMELLSKREQEQQLLKRRNDLEIKLKDTYRIVEKAENLMSNLTMALGYINLDLKDISIQIEDMRQRQMLGLRIIKAQEDERQRVARDIHDGPAQSMSNVALKAELCERLIDIDSEKAKSELKNLKKIIRLSLQEVRKIIYDLRPMSIDDLGLVPTLQKYVSNFEEESGINVRFNINGSNDTLNPGISVTIFRVVQEALSNIIKHSEASNVLLNLELTNEKLGLLIFDNGKGFDIQQANAAREDVSGGFGLINMRERVELINGEFKINSTPGKGTNIVIIIPLQPEGVKEDE